MISERITIPDGDYGADDDPEQADVDEFIIVIEDNDIRFYEAPIQTLPGIGGFPTARYQLNREV